MKNYITNIDMITMTDGGLNMRKLPDVEEHEL